MRRLPLLALAAVASSLALPAGAQSPAPAPTTPPPADLVVTNARIYTVDDARPLAAAMAVRGGRVQFVGDSRGALALRGPRTRVVDLGGRTVIPGMVDAHGHLSGLGLGLRNVDLVGTTSYDDVIARVVARARTAPKGSWVVGRGWDQNDWGDTRFPTHEALSRALPDHPVYLERVDGHAALVNAAGMRAAAITRDTKDPEGGRLERTPSGDPTGVFVDRAQGLVERAIPNATRDELREALRAATRELHRYGLVGVHSAGEGRATIELMEEMAQRGELDLRANIMIGDDSAALRHYFARGPRRALHDGRLWVSSVKLYADGALGSRGAALLEPYADDPNNSGLLLSAPAHIQDVATRALRAGFQVNTHAIGDRGNRVVLDAYEAAFKAVPVADHRFRVEHAQILHHEDVPRFAALGVIPSMQASHQTSDMYWAGNRLGQGRLLGAYAWRALIDAGSIVPNGSDFPVELVNPLISFHASVARQDAKNWPSGGWYPEQRMTREEALKSMTLWPAYSGFQEGELGSLSTGKRADFVVLDRDIMRVPAEEILATRVLATWFGGRAVYEAKGEPAGGAQP
ncbi:amidohydrolase [Roseisolibacter sp. H3M3-2]|uniref:amidohydrolase n=1 Tax=Roseisolibacter sp. H3M3-2 TaxID=3031323 RepID=UPI0023DBD056|nr:amidohydrolase [Roseisolibacter sp. H3M3-2]MDF1504205.1 amidohydrolase [Roseisolibacter sp. H3M3-2]